MKGLTRRAEKEALRAAYRQSKNRFKVKKDKTGSKGVRTQKLGFKMVQVRGVGVKTRMERRES